MAALVVLGAMEPYCELWCDRSKPAALPNRRSTVAWARALRRRR